MSKVCVICGKKPQGVIRRKKLRSRYNPTTKGRSIPNLQRITITPHLSQKLKMPVGKKIWVCAKCLKGLFKNK